MLANLQIAKSIRAVAEPLALPLSTRATGSMISCKRQLLANLILRAGLILQGDLDDAQEIAASLERSLEAVLVESGFLDQKQLQLSLRAVFFIEREYCNEQIAVNGLAMTCRKRIEFEEGLRYFGWGW